MDKELTTIPARRICSKSLYTNNLVVDAGFEPAKAMPADLQSALVVHLSNLPNGRGGIRTHGPRLRDRWFSKPVHYDHSATLP